MEQKQRKISEIKQFNLNGSQHEINEINWMMMEWIELVWLNGGARSVSGPPKAFAVMKNLFWMKAVVGRQPNQTFILFNFDLMKEN